MANQGLLVLLAVGACVLVCSPKLANAACCMAGQPTYQGSEVRFGGIPTCSDGPCSGTGFDYLKKGAVESPDRNACCDRGDMSMFIVNPQPGQGTWPGFPEFPHSFDGTSQQCDASLAVFRCHLSGQEKPNPKGFSFKRFM